MMQRVFRVALAVVALTAYIDRYRPPTAAVTCQVIRDGGEYFVLFDFKPSTFLDTAQFCANLGGRLPVVKATDADRTPRMRCYSCIVVTTTTMTIAGTYGPITRVATPSARRWMPTVGCTATTRHSIQPQSSTRATTMATWRWVNAAIACVI